MYVVICLVGIIEMQSQLDWSKCICCTNSLQKGCRVTVEATTHSVLIIFCCRRRTLDLAFASLRLSVWPKFSKLKSDVMWAVQRTGHYWQWWQEENTDLGHMFEYSIVCPYFEKPKKKKHIIIGVADKAKTTTDNMVVCRLWKSKLREPFSVGLFYISSFPLLPYFQPLKVRL